MTSFPSTSLTFCMTLNDCLPCLDLYLGKPFFAFDLLFALAKEIVVPVLQLFHCILQCLASYFLEPRQFFLEFGYFYGIIIVILCLLAFFVGSDSLSEEIVVEV